MATKSSSHILVALDPTLFPSSNSFLNLLPDMDLVDQIVEGRLVGQPFD
ncbi:MAG: hypothetical protein AAGM22_06485 [Acidobacteriota bacterium]